jgi:dolichyl-phosphate-mannose--protein O-mannosyl transferase
MDMYLGLFIAGVLILIAIYTLYQEANILNLLTSFFLLSFISYFTIYIIDFDFKVDINEEDN